LLELEDNFGQIPVGFTLEQNFSNPFNPSTTIRYQLPKATQVVLKLYNTFDQEVRTPTAVGWSMRASLPV
jgi:hypothetical protein